MIDISREVVVSLCKAARMIPSSRSEHGIDVSTLHRWARRGIRGQRLEVFHAGGTACTSLEALGRFFQAIGKARGDDASTVQHDRPMHQWTSEVLNAAKLNEPSRKRTPRHSPRLPQEHGSASRTGASLARPMHTALPLVDHPAETHGDATRAVVHARHISAASDG